MVKGRVDHKEGETKMIALEIAPFEASADKGEVRLRLDARKAPAGTIRELAEVVRSFPGESEVVSSSRPPSARRRTRSAPSSGCGPSPTSTPRSRRCSAKRRSASASVRQAAALGVGPGGGALAAAAQLRGEAAERSRLGRRRVGSAATGEGRSTGLREEGARPRRMEVEQVWREVSAYLTPRAPNIPSV